MLLLGVLAAQAEAAAPAGDYDLLQTEILTGTASSVTFSSLNSTYGTDYQHLQLRVVQLLNYGSARVTAIRLNSDTGSNYSLHGLFGNGSAVSSYGYSSLTYMDYGLDLGTGSSWTASVIDLLDPFETTKSTTMRSLSGVASSDIRLASGAWHNTAAVTDISFVSPAGGSFNIGSRFSLYGLKAA
jgi:hypothetical protein